MLTGGSGAVASTLRPLLRRGGHALTLVDLAGPTSPPDPEERVLVADVTDQDSLTEGFRGADLVVHLAGHRSERPWSRIAAVNVGGTQTVLEASRLAGVPRVLLASSIHAVGCLPAQRSREEVEPAPCPDTYYGVSKAAGEALGRLYAGRHGMAVVAARIGTAEQRPSSRRSLHTWLSPADAARLVEAAARLQRPGGHVVWGVSDNTRRWVRHEAGAAIGFHPQDDAEEHAGALGDPPPLPLTTLLGGDWTTDEKPVGGTW